MITGLPAVLMVWDETLSEYARAEDDRCTALWASSSWPDHVRGGICGRKADFGIGDVPLCKHHYERTLAASERIFDANAEHHRRAVARVAEAHRQEAAALAEQQLAHERERLALGVRPDPAGNVVYFAQRASDRLIKIGTTRNLHQRLGALIAEHGPVQLLLVRPGSYREESDWHFRFAALRVSGEWFRPGSALLKWINDTRLVP